MSSFFAPDTLPLSESLPEDEEEEGEGPSRRLALFFPFRGFFFPRSFARFFFRLTFFRCFRFFRPARSSAEESDELELGLEELGSELELCLGRLADLACGWATDTPVPVGGADPDGRPTLNATWGNHTAGRLGLPNSGPFGGGIALPTP